MIFATHFNMNCMFNLFYFHYRCRSKLRLDDRMKFCEVTNHNHRPTKMTQKTLAPVQTIVKPIVKPILKSYVKPTVVPTFVTNVQQSVRPMNKLPARSLQRTSLPNLMTYKATQVAGNLIMTKIPKENFHGQSFLSLSGTEDFSSEVTDEVELVTNDKEWTLMFLNGYKFTKYFENKTCVSYRCTMYPKQASDCQARLKHNKLTKNVFMRSEHNHPADEGAYAQFVKSAISVKRIKDMGISKDALKKKPQIQQKSQPQQHLIQFPKPRMNRETPSTYKRESISTSVKEFDDNIVIKEEVVDDDDDYINCVQVEMNEEAQNRDNSSLVEMGSNGLQNRQ